MRSNRPALTLLLAATLAGVAGCDMVPSPGHQSEAARKAAEDRKSVV